MKAQRKIMAVFLLSLILASTLGSTGFAGTPKRGGDCVIFTSRVSKLNPAIATGMHPWITGAQLFAGLIQMDDKFNYGPYLAKSWEVSKDGLTYTFHLVEGATFHDGKPITSEDVAFSFEVVKKHHPYAHIMFGAVDRVETPDPYTAVFKLNKPHPALLMSVSCIFVPILPKHVYSTHPIRKHPANNAPVGSGPFKFVDRKLGEYLILERNENFFRPGRPYLDRLIYKVIKGSTALQLSLQRNEVHFAGFAQVRVRDLERLKKFKNLEVTIKGYEAVNPSTYLEFNLRKKPFDDKRVRQAISAAIDREFITQKLHLGYSNPGVGPIPQKNPYHHRGITNIRADLEKANKLLDETGYPRKADGMRFSCTLMWYPAAPDSQITLAEYLKPQLRKVGIDVKLVPAPDFTTWIKRVSNWEHDMTMNAIYTYPDPLAGVHKIYLSRNIKKRIWTNTAGYSNPKVDELLDKASVEMDFAKRKELYKEFTKIVTEDMPYCWTHQLPYITVYNSGLEGVPLTVWGPLAPYDTMYWEKKPQ